MPYVRSGAAVVDVGASLGFLARLFVERTDCSIVVAIEPESRNVLALRRASQRWGRGRVQVVDAAVADLTGVVKLRVDARNHADHQLADDGIEVRSVRLDDLVDELGIGDVGLVKIDVQGAEERVPARRPGPARSAPSRSLRRARSEALEASGVERVRGPVDPAGPLVRVRNLGGGAADRVHDGRRAQAPGDRGVP